jgi:hypothetical protein
MKKQRKMRKPMLHFKKHLGYLYRIVWDSGQIDVLENGDVPTWFTMEDMSKYAIVSASNPNGEKLSVRENKERNEKLESYLKRSGIGYIRVIKESISGLKKRTPAFLLMETTQEKAKLIAQTFQQETFVSFRMDPDLHIDLVGLGINFDGLRWPIFRYDDSPGPKRPGNDDDSPNRD